MPLSIESKKVIAEELHDRFMQAQSVILTEYKGLNVATINLLRKKLREVGAEYRVVKNTLLVKASENTDVALIKENFNGPSAVAIILKDSIAGAKVLTEFAKTNDKIKIRVGVMAGRVLNPIAITALSNMPPREVLLSQLLSLMNSVPASFVRVLSGTPRKLLYVLQGIRDKKQLSEN